MDLVSLILGFLVQERSSHGRSQTGVEKFWEPNGKLSLRQSIYPGSSENEGPTRTYVLDGVLETRFTPCHRLNLREVSFTGDQNLQKKSNLQPIQLAHRYHLFHQIPT